MMRKILVCVALAVLLFTAPLNAQINDDSVSEGNIERLPDKNPVLEWVLSGVFLLAALGVGFNASKRSHN
ncbi:MAG: hypothetical protein ABII12_01575 [Planctomycetota bacterium]